MKTIIVTGGAGFIGSNFIWYMFSLHGDIRIVNYDKLTYAGNLENLRGISEGARYRFVRGDIADRKTVFKVFEEERPWAVVNFAAESHVDRSILDSSPFIETNVKGTQVLLEASRCYGSPRFIQISTDEVYGSLGETGAFKEDAPLRPTNPYAASKAAAELIALAYGRTYNVPVVITRSSNNYGPYQFPEKLIPLMIRNALLGKPLPVYGQGCQIRDWLYVEDNCRAIDKVLWEGRPGEIYNIGGGFEKRNIEVVHLVCDLLESELRLRNEWNGEFSLKHLITHVPDPRGGAHDFRYALNCDKIREQLGWAPRVSFSEGLRRTIQWYLEHRSWVEQVISGGYRWCYDKKSERAEEEIEK